MKKLVKLAMLIGGVALVGKVIAAKKAEWAGLTESEVRTKLDAKIGDRMPEDKKGDIGDKVVSKLRDRGMLAEDAPAPVSHESAEGSDA